MSTTKRWTRPSSTGSRLVCETEYQNSLIVEALRTGPQSVREISAKTGLEVYNVSQRLVDVERWGPVEFHGYDGTTPKFIRTDA